MKYCNYCKKPMSDKRTSAMYCSSGCKSQAYRKRKGIAPPSFLNRERSGNQRHRLSTLTAEEESIVNTLQIEIKSYIEPLQDAEKKYSDCHSLVAKYELGVLPIPSKWRKDSKPQEPYQFYECEPIREKFKTETKYEEELKKHKVRMKYAEEIRIKYEDWEKNPYKTTAEKEIYTPFKIAEKQLKQINEEIVKRKNQIEQIIGVATERQKSKSKIITGKDLSKMVFDTLSFDGKWLELLGEPSKCFYALIWGDAKAGKSYFSVEFAQYLTKFGKTLYIAVEEGYGATLQKKVIDMQAWDIEIKETRNFSNIESFILGYSFVFIDSVTMLNITPDQIEHLRTLYPNTSFVVLLQSVKAGANFKGDQAWKHNVDFVVEIQKTDENESAAICSGRFGNNSLKYNYKTTKNTIQNT